MRQFLRLTIVPISISAFYVDFMWPIFFGFLFNTHYDKLFVVINVSFAFQFFMFVFQRESTHNYVARGAAIRTVVHRTFRANVAAIIVVYPCQLSMGIRLLFHTQTGKCFNRTHSMRSTVITTAMMMVAVGQL